LEIYQDDIFDLFDVRQKRKIVVLPNAVEVKDVKLVALPSAKRASDFLDIGNSLRTTEFTMANDSSSRSHAVFSIHLETSYETDGVVKVRHLLHLYQFIYLLSSLLLIRQDTLP
jgi:hypothetical protein